VGDAVDGEDGEPVLLVVVAGVVAVGAFECGFVGMKKIEGAAVGRTNLVTLFFEDLNGTAADKAAASENDDVHGFSLWCC